MTNDEMPRGATMLVRSYVAGDEAAVIDLWRRCGLIRPQNNPRADIRRKMEVAPESFLVGEIDTKIVATAMAGYEGHRGWVNYLAVAPHLQRQGCGREIMEHAERFLRERGCPKINLQVRATNKEAIEFYKRIGFAIDDVVSMGKRLITDDPFDGERGNT
jgi:ribosomal protein S18 acetylase RimI-like enzyme